MFFSRVFKSISPVLCFCVSILPTFFPLQQIDLGRLSLGCGSGKGVAQTRHPPPQVKTALRI